MWFSLGKRIIILECTHLLHITQIATECKLISFTEHLRAFFWRCLFWLSDSRSCADLISFSLQLIADNSFGRYGPFWICTTLIFVAAAIGTFVTYLAHKLQHKEWDYDINLVTWSAGLFYGYVTFVPVGLYIILKYFSAPSGLAQLWCLYGYSLFVFIPASVS